MKNGDRITGDIYLNTQLNYDYDSVPAEATDEEDLTFLFGVELIFRYYFQLCLTLDPMSDRVREWLFQQPAS